MVQAKVALKRAKRKDFYRILGVQQDATEEEIRKQYRKKALLYHPGQTGQSKGGARRRKGGGGMWAGGACWSS